MGTRDVAKNRWRPCTFRASSDGSCAIAPGNRIEFSLPPRLLKKAYAAAGTRHVRQKLAGGTCGDHLPGARLLREIEGRNDPLLRHRPVSKNSPASAQYIQHQLVQSRRGARVETQIYQSAPPAIQRRRHPPTETLS